MDDARDALDDSEEEEEDDDDSDGDEDEEDANAKRFINGGSGRFTFSPAGGSASGGKIGRGSAA